MSGGSSDESTRPDAGGPDSETTEWTLPSRPDWLTAPRAVACVTVVALLARVLTLGARTAHWDEARVAYWSYYYAETGSLGYHYEEHGPLLQITARWFFELFGMNDFAIRLPVAIVGGLLPATAVCFRNHLRDSELVALAVFLGGNSALLYYSRFMRSDMLVATFMFAAFGLLVRFYDTREARYLYPTGVLIALGFGSKENALVYLLTWAGAATLITDQWLHSPAADDSGTNRLRSSWVGTFFARLRGFVFGSQRAKRLSESGRVKRGLWIAGNGVLAGIAMIYTAVFVFADRGGGVGARYVSERTSETPNVAGVLTNPLLIPETLRSTKSEFGEWLGKSSEKTISTYVDFFGGFLDVLLSNAIVLVGFAVVGILLERYGREKPRWLVLFMSYCAVASLVGYPLGTDVQGSWTWVSVHIIVPLAVPAAVGAVWVVRTGSTLYRQRDTIGTVIVVVILALAAFQMGTTVVTDVYTQPQADDNQLVQFAQPHSDLTPVVEKISAVSEQTDGRDVMLYYGLPGQDYDDNAALVRKNGTASYWDIRPTCSVWGNTQPLNWYFAATDATVDCERSADQLRSTLQTNPPPVVITHPDDWTRPELLNSTYRQETYYLRTVGQKVVVHTHQSVASAD